jgi:hypothetical protein
MDYIKATGVFPETYQTPSNTSNLSILYIAYLQHCHSIKSERVLNVV